jgi:dihydrofolate reductase
MDKPKIHMIAAVAKNNVIGKSNDLPWYIPEDLKKFKDLTLGKTVLMGRKTYESILNRLGKPLPNRKHIVITKDQAYEAKHPDVVVLHDLNQALDGLKDDVMVIGGGEIYKQMMDLADVLHITHVHKDIEGDTFFPEIDNVVWRKESEEPGNGFTWVKYVRN